MKLPFDPLYALYNYNIYTMREKLKIGYPRLNKLIKNGLTIDEADEFAIKCDYHPAEIWGIETWIKALGGKW